MKLLVRNLARTTTEPELIKLFKDFGRVQSCDVVLDKATGKSKGFAFVEMPKAGEAKVAIKKLNGMDVAGNKIRVKKAEDKVEDTAEKIDEVVDETPAASEEATRKSPWKEIK